LAWSPANATTESETALINSPLPHEKLGGGRESTKVHWVRLQGYVEGKTGHVAMLDELKAQVQRCVLAPLSGQSQPTRVCSLMEVRGAVAQLASTKGFCEIDFIHKTALGVCDARAHRDAPAVVHIGPQAPGLDGRARVANAPSQAAIASMEKAMKQFGPIKTGQRKTIAGIECDVQANPLFGTVCISRGGAFAGWHTGPGAAGSRMELELTNVGGVNAHAVKARLDSTVNEAVFAPYLADGFQVTNIARRK
jgi:hypothetical protein